MHLFTLFLALVAAALAQQTQVNYMVDCARFPQPCNLKCYAIFKSGAPNPLTYDGPHTPTVRRQRRQSAGTIPNPCCGNPARITGPATCQHPVTGLTVPCSSPDEYPYAASAEYGNGPAGIPSYIRCTGARENTDEGSNWSSALSRTVANGGCGGANMGPAGCAITIGFMNVDIRADACVNRAAATNYDSSYWTYNGAYTLAARDGNSTEPEKESWAHSEPDPSLFIEPERRRELLLDNGNRIIVPPSNKSWEGELFVMGETESARVVRELLGEERSALLRNQE